MNLKSLLEFIQEKYTEPSIQKLYIDSVSEIIPFSLYIEKSTLTLIIKITFSKIVYTHPSSFFLSIYFEVLIHLQELFKSMLFVSERVDSKGLYYDYRVYYNHFYESGKNNTMYCSYDLCFLNPIFNEEIRVCGNNHYPAFKSYFSRKKENIILNKLQMQPFQFLEQNDILQAYIEPVYSTKLKKAYNENKYYWYEYPTFLNPKTLQKTYLFTDFDQNIEYYLCYEEKPYFLLVQDKSSSIIFEKQIAIDLPYRILLKYLNEDKSTYLVPAITLGRLMFLTKNFLEIISSWKKAIQLEFITPAMIFKGYTPNETYSILEYESEQMYDIYSTSKKKTLIVRHNLEYVENKTYLISKYAFPC